MTITQADIDAYARVSGDFNPIHVDPAFASTTAYGSTIAHGTLSTALIARQLQQSAGAGANVTDLALRFVSPIRSGDTLRVQMEWTAQADPPGRRRLNVSTVNQHGQSVAIGDAVVEVSHG